MLSFDEYARIEVSTLSMFYGLKPVPGRPALKVAIRVVISEKASEKYFKDWYGVQSFFDLTKVEQEVILRGSTLEYSGAEIELARIKKAVNQAYADAHSALVKMAGDRMTESSKRPIMRMPQHHWDSYKFALDEALNTRNNTKLGRVHDASCKTTLLADRIFDDEEGQETSLKSMFTMEPDVKFSIGLRSPGLKIQMIYNKIEVLNQVVKNPVTGEEKALSLVIIDLNDDQGWTFNHIADWLDTLDIDTTIASREEV